MQVLCETLDIGMTNMEQIVHTPHDGYNQHTHHSNTHRQMQKNHEYTKNEACPVLRTSKEHYYYYRFRLSADPSQVWEHVRRNLVYSQGERF